MAVQAGVSQEGGSMAGDGVGDRLDDDTGEGPLQGWPVDPGVDDFREGGGAGDYPEVVGAGQSEPAGDRAVPQYGLGEAVEDQGAAGYGGG
ncbi:hypothetical protein JBF12_08790 [Streptomyces javensis]|uniref:Uncharacterized protein n=1 Tax=Streptomyces javensis TaxID=114698 RepID=A0ABS0R7P6_9ACTN|nr:hypothetical protein [Streptomyces javensis]